MSFGEKINAVNNVPVDPFTCSQSTNQVNAYSSPHLWFSFNWMELARFQFDFHICLLPLVAQTDIHSDVNMHVLPEATATCNLILQGLSLPK